MSDRLDGLTFDTPDAGSLAGDVALWEMYRSSFPSTEREPSSVIVSSVRDEVGVVVRARDETATVGFSFVHLLDGPPPAVFLVYLVVAAAARSLGLGQALFGRTWGRASARHATAGRDAIGMIWEVEMPRLAASPDERHQRERRIRFFERLGGAVLPSSYRQPPVDGVSPVPMQLMFFRPDGGDELPDLRTVDSLVRAIYQEKYQRRNGIPAEAIDALLSTGGVHDL